MDKVDHPVFSISPRVIHHELNLYTISDAIAETILLSSSILSDTLSLPNSLEAANPQEFTFDVKLTSCGALNCRGQGSIGNQSKLHSLIDLLCFAPRTFVFPLFTLGMQGTLR